MYCIWRFFFNPFLKFLLSSWCWNVVRWEAWERQKHTTEQADVSLHYCIQEWQRGCVGVAGGGEGCWGPNQKTKKICTTTSVDRKQSGGHLMACDVSRCHILLAAFLWGFPFISLNIQIIRTILSCQIKKIYRGSLGFFFSTTKKRYGKYL